MVTDKSDGGDIQQGHFSREIGGKMVKWLCTTPVLCVCAVIVIVGSWFVPFVDKRKLNSKYNGNDDDNNVKGREIASLYEFIIEMGQR